LIEALQDIVSFKETRTAREIRQELDYNIPSPHFPPLSSEKETMSQTLPLPPLHLTPLLLSDVIKRKESTCSKRRCILWCNGTEKPHPWRAWSSWDLEGPSGRARRALAAGEATACSGCSSSAGSPALTTRSCASWHR